MDLDKVLASTPVDRVTARVTSTGTHYTVKLKPAPNQYSQDIPTLVTTIPPHKIAHILDRRFGRFTVVGYLVPLEREVGATLNGLPILHGVDRGARWLVRCACGIYEVRTSKAILNPANKNDACRQCRQWQYLRRQEYKKRFGQWPADDYGW